MNGLIISKNALHDVLDGNVSDDLVTEMSAIAAQVEGVRKIEKCRIRKSGIGMFIELHVWIDGDLSVREGHSIGHLVKNRVQNEVPRVIDTVVHIEPAAEAPEEKITSDAPVVME